MSLHVGPRLTHPVCLVCYGHLKPWLCFHKSHPSRQYPASDCLRKNVPNTHWAWSVHRFLLIERVRRLVRPRQQYQNWRHGLRSSTRTWLLGVLPSQSGGSRHLQRSDARSASITLPKSRGHTIGADSRSSPISVAGLPVCWWIFLTLIRHAVASWSTGRRLWRPPLMNRCSLSEETSYKQCLLGLMPISCGRSFTIGLKQRP